MKKIAVMLFVLAGGMGALAAQETERFSIEKFWANIERKTAQAALANQEDQARKNSWVRAVWSVQGTKEYRVRRFGGLGGGTIKIGWGRKTQETRECAGEIEEGKGIVVDASCVLPKNYQDKSIALISAQAQHRKTGETFRLGRLVKHSKNENLRVFLFEEKA